MDKINQYQEILISILHEYAALGNPVNGLQRQVIVDKEKNHYLLVTVGWRKEKQFVYIVAFHFDITDGKVWIQQNNTEAHIEDELIDRGIPSADIIIGFQPPFARQYSGFAVA